MGYAEFEESADIDFNRSFSVLSCCAFAGLRVCSCTIHFSCRLLKDSKNCVHSLTGISRGRCLCSDCLPEKYLSRNRPTEPSSKRTSYHWHSRRSEGFGRTRMTVQGSPLLGWPASPANRSRSPYR